MENLDTSPNPYDDAAVPGDRFEPPDSTAQPEPNDPAADNQGYPVPGGDPDRDSDEQTTGAKGR